MQHLGQTRSAQRAHYSLLTPDTFVRAPLPGMVNATAIVHAAPAMGAKFTQYTAEFEPGGSLGPTAVQRFVYVLEGNLEAGGELAPGQYVYVPVGMQLQIRAVTQARATVIEKPFQTLEGCAAPEMFSGNENALVAKFFLDDPDVEMRQLIPDHPRFDFAVNTMTFNPGATLPIVEIHVMEHGLLMLAGGGIYRLGDDWYPVTVGDFIYMAPYCPQWFGALGKTPAKYLLYKDWNRLP